MQAALRHLGLICIPFLLAAAPLLSFYRDNQTEVELGALIIVVGRPRLLGAVALGLAIWALVLVVSPTSEIVRYEHDNPGLSSSDPRVWATSLAAPTVPSGVRKPDIYVLCPDDYARHDVLAHYFHYDNGPFLRRLERRGFVVSPESRSPYSDSEQNIAAEMNMDYLSRLPHILGAKSEDSRPVRRLIQDNRASRILKELGYHYVHIDTDEVTWGEGIRTSRTWALRTAS